ncbi:hypothetical protein PR202_gb19564 [Eleusine coracana subsp. coracana]|uniref:DNA topoisomerase (ATP-hydrolyzing) n=1 Tax=Eleusine coracana subsp. coracana TaxID=191504 RepID=A0AAV5F6A6_ELECO|nr:hypothetical protein PR202_gb19564 [Eleusine coracana subsp. coracana]
MYVADQKQHNPTMDTLSIEVDVAKCRISLYYNGKASRSRSTRAMVFSENMGKKSEPQITDYRKGVNWTMFTFKPDLARFNLTHLEHDDVVLLMKMRVIDMAGILGMNQVVFNGDPIPLKSFSHYAYQYIKSASRDRKEDLPWIFEKVNDKWDICVSLSDGQFQQLHHHPHLAEIATKSGRRVRVATAVLAQAALLLRTHVRPTRQPLGLMGINHGWVLSRLGSYHNGAPRPPASLGPDHRCISIKLWRPWLLHLGSPST